MDFVVISKDVPVCRISGCSDVIHINGIGGYGKWNGQSFQKSIVPIGWSVDMLPKSKLVRLFCNKPLEAGPPLSSMEIFAVEK